MTVGSKFQASPNFLHGTGSADSDFFVLGNLYVSGTLVGGNITGSSSTGSISDGTNVGGGAGIFQGKSGVNLQFRTLLATGSIAFISGSQTLTISGSVFSGTITSAANTGSGQGIFQGIVSGSSLLFNSLSGSGNITILSGSNTITISGSTNTAFSNGLVRVNDSVTPNYGALTGTFAQGNDARFLQALGPSGSIQYNNNNNSITGSTAWNINSTFGTLSGSGPILLGMANGASATSVSSSLTDGLMLTCHNVAGFPKLIANITGSYYNYDLMMSLVGKSIHWVEPSQGALSTFGGAGTSTTGTIATPGPSVGSIFTSCKRITLSSSNAAAQVAGWASNSALYARGNVDNQGGFYFYTRFAVPSAAENSGSRALVGLATGTVATNSFLSNNNPTLAKNIIGIGYEDSDPVANGFYIISTDNTGASTKVQLSSSLSGTAARDGSVYNLHLYCPPNASFIGVRVGNLSTGQTIYDNPNFNGTLPLKTVFLVPQVFHGSSTSGQGATVAFMSTVFYSLI